MAVPELQHALLRWQVLHRLRSAKQPRVELHHSFSMTLSREERAVLLPVQASDVGGDRWREHFSMKYEGTSWHELKNYAWVFGALLDSEDCMKNNLW